MQLIENWRGELRRLWSVRVAVGGAAFWSLVGGAILIWPALVDRISIWAYVGGGIALSVAYGVARFLKQPGTDE